MTTLTVPVAGAMTEAVEPVVDSWPRARLATLRGPMTVHAFVSPDCSYEAMRKLLGQARQSLRLYIYNVSADDMLALLRAAVHRGVDVRIMYDATDTREGEIAKLEALGGVALRVAPSRVPRRAFTVCHQKFAVIDGRTVIIESANWATTSIPNPGGKRWKKGNREWFVALESVPAAELFTELFDLDWEWTPPIEELPMVTLAPEPVEVWTGFGEEIPPLGEIMPPARFEVNATTTLVPILSPQNYFDEMLAAIERAKKSVWIEQQYIKAPDGSPFVGPMLAVLKKKKAKLDIRIVSSAKYPSGWDDTLETLMNYGLKSKLKGIDLRQFTHCHNKGVIVDGKTVIVSSTNWSDNSIGAAREAGLLIKDADIAGYFARAFDFDWRTGLRPNEVEALVSTASQELATPGDEVHPADLV
jgi:phosphatidylserine/phosphatidylglycerophosphate/cardiolipin synthase-like enzyme